MDTRIIITLSGDDEQYRLGLDVEGDNDFLTVLGLLEAAKADYLRSKFLQPPETSQ